MQTIRNRSLGHAFAILEVLVHADEPQTATAIAEQIGVHQTTASRILADLIQVGYVRRVSYRRFAPDYGLLTLGLDAATHFPVLAGPRLVMEHAARICPGLTVSLTMYWRRQLLYFDQASRGLETRVFNGADFPLHLSSPGLLFLLELPHDQALSELQVSRQKFGWPQPTGEVPPTEDELLRSARRNLLNDTLILADWQERGHISAAIRLPDLDTTPLALALSGPTDVMSAGAIRLRLQEIRRLLRGSLSSAG